MEFRRRRRGYIILKAQIPRILFIVSGLLLGILFLAPMWRISLYAPQYRDGVHMHIYINKIGGKTPGTLQNVNILNHYIGMKPIVPESIPELTYFPYIVIGFIMTALLCALINHRYLYAMWFFVFLVALALAMYDFYLWEYDYGHNLADNAPMKFEDESFQPPLIGSKKLLNFTAISVPHIGGWMIIISFFFTAAATYVKYGKSKNLLLSN